MKIKDNILGMQKMLNSMSIAIEDIQRSHSLINSIPTDLINHQIKSLAPPLRDITKEWEYIFKNVDVAALERATIDLTDSLRASEILGINNSIQELSRHLSLQMSFKDSFKHLNAGIDPKMFGAIHGLSLDASAINNIVQNNLKLFKEYDWSAIIDDEGLAELEIENALDGIIVDISDGISFQQQISEFISKLKSRYPLLFMIFCMLVVSPLQSAIGDAILSKIKGITEPIIEQANVNYKVIEKSFKVEIYNTLNINIESKGILEEILKSYAYVSTEKLIIRQSNKAKSKALYTLEFGQVVRIICKNKNWTLVEYENEEDVIRGWVFTRYLTKFNK